MKCNLPSSFNLCIKKSFKRIEIVINIQCMMGEDNEITRSFL